MLDIYLYYTQYQRNQYIFNDNCVAKKSEKVCYIDNTTKQVETKFMLTHVNYYREEFSMSRPYIDSELILIILYIDQLKYC